MATTSTRGFLDGQLLIAMPGMGDQRFARSLVYMCAHSEEGAMGIVLNQIATHVNFPDLLVQLDVIAKEERSHLPPLARELRVHKGGPVETGRGFVLHAPDYFIESSTLPIDEGVCLTATVEILRAIAQGKGPSRALLAFGYAGWAPGQLEEEIRANGWLTCRPDPDLIFGDDLEQKYERALASLGVDLRLLSSEAGNA